MQKFLRQAPLVFFAYLLLAILLGVLLDSLNYWLIVTNHMLWFTLSLLVPVSLTVVSIVKRNELSKASIFAAQAFPLLAVAYSFYASSPISGVSNGLIAVSTLIPFLCAYVLSLLRLGSHWVRGMIVALNTLLLLLFLGLFFLAVTFGSLGETSVFRESVSLGEQYVASIEVVDSGALGGATNVLVEDRATSIPVGFGRFARVKYVYSGEWNEFRTTFVKWKDYHTLVVNWKEFTMSNEFFQSTP